MRELTFSASWIHAVLVSETPYGAEDGHLDRAGRLSGIAFRWLSHVIAIKCMGILQELADGEGWLS